jgi:hypothetical protein
MKPSFNWKAKEAWAKGLTLEAIRYSIADARAAERAWPDGENAGYYLDEIHVLVGELNRRQGARP